jgi:hypothetical protein
MRSFPTPKPSSRSKSASFQYSSDNDHHADAETEVEPLVRKKSNYKGRGGLATDNWTEESRLDSLTRSIELILRSGSM